MRRRGRRRVSALLLVSGVLATTIAGTASAVSASTTAPSRPLEVLVVGDSVGLTLGIQLFLAGPRYHAQVWDYGILGCGFITGEEIRYMGQPSGENGQCVSERSFWLKKERSIHPQVVVIEMGWWDCFDHYSPAGQLQHLGERRYDEQLRAAILRLAKELSGKGVPVVFLSVPWMRPNGPGRPPDADARFAAARTRHREINAMLRRVAASLGARGRYLDISPEVTPSGHFQRRAFGGICRDTDGVHFWTGVGLRWRRTRCGNKVAGALFPVIRAVAAASLPSHGRTTLTGCRGAVASLDSGVVRDEHLPARRGCWVVPTA